MVVGEGMKYQEGISAQILSALNEQNISPQMINQGASQISIMIGTKKEEADQVVKTIYKQFF